MRYKLMFSFFLLLAIGNSTAQSLERSIALLDLSERNDETNDGQTFSAEHILKVTGIPFLITSNPSEAMQYAMIFCSSELNTRTLTSDEKTSLAEYITEGGILVAPRVLDDELYPIFGISDVTASNVNYLINWNQNLNTSLFRWIDEDEERTISLADESSGNIFKTYSYGLDGSTALAYFGNGEVAVTQNGYGTGFSYIFGVSWKDLILRSLINRDHEAQRISSNGFEPTMDVIMLMIRAIFNEHIPYSTWKHTSLANSTSTLMITHDIDSYSGVEEMLLFSDSEKERGIHANYNVTVRYFSDYWMTDFYYFELTHPNINQLIADGQEIGSHSVGHFPDFGDEAIFPIGVKGLTSTNYTPNYDGTVTTGGTVYGELEVSKKTLETDFGIDIRIYRTGHLVYNDYMVEVMDDLGYLYNSSYGANEVLTNFPFQNKTGRSFSGENSNVYELPVSISDVYHSDPISADNYIEKVNIWLDIIAKIDANNASTVLLIHPNHDYKLWSQEYLIEHLPGNIAIKEMGAFGDYWRAREDFDFTTQIIDNKINITIPSEDLLLDENISLIIDKGQNLDEVILKDENGNPIHFDSENWEDNSIVIFDIGIILGSSDNPDIANEANKFHINIYPNPTHNRLNIELDIPFTSNIDIELVDIYGKTIKKSETYANVFGHQNMNINLSELSLANGLYFCKIIVDGNIEAVKKILIN